MYDISCEVNTFINQQTKTYWVSLINQAFPNVRLQSGDACIQKVTTLKKSKGLIDPKQTLKKTVFEESNTRPRSSALSRTVPMIHTDDAH